MDYVRKLYQQLTEFVSQSAISAMRRLGVAFGRTKRSSLMSLPPELRLMIIEHLFAGSNADSNCIKYRSVLCLDIKAKDIGPIPPLLHVCQLLREEGLAILYSMSTIWLKNIDELLEVANKVPESVPLWTNVHFKESEWARRSVRESIGVLERLPKLRSLSIRIDNRIWGYKGQDELPGWVKIQGQLHDALPVLVRLDLLEVVYNVAIDTEFCDRMVKRCHVMEKKGGAWVTTSNKLRKGDWVLRKPGRRTEPETGRWRPGRVHTCAELDLELQEADGSVEDDTSSASDSSLTDE
ncbi:hypothetical protein LTR56_016112 [Elasticomyces elasticus]|nr:hypothetical protein LTR56_016112 [Elasticomyces elasticus]KAK3636239.1 hypothetical protein LTR22_018844 [Elasticomyces elasticus]KAK4918333.1 hypothetical protein LTR49_013883 [Elasticomyces elasticus]KAK5762717.1 hypothetical protein LTS12_007106 [Elasticomyces elasticus]